MWFKDLLSASDDVSHKRFISLVAMLMIIATHIESACGIQVDYQLTYVFVGLVIGQSALTMIEKKKI